MGYVPLVYFSSKDTVRLFWKNIKGTKEYILTFTDSLKTPVLSFLVKDTAISIIASELKKGSYYWNATPSNKPCKNREMLQLTLITKSTEDIMVAEIIRSINNDYNSEDIYNAEISEALHNRGLIDKAYEYLSKFWK